MPEISYHQVFNKLYYHLYSNSSSSRAEKIFDDVGRILLVKILSEDSGGGQALKSFMEEGQSSSAVLTPMLEKNARSLAHGTKFSFDDAVLRDAFRIVLPFNLSEAPSTVLGEAFQALIGPRLRGDKGQFFTPRTVVKAMVRIADPKPGFKVVDPAAGTGGFLLEAHLYRSMTYPRHKKIGPIIGLEKDEDIQSIGSALLEVATKGTGNILLANSLSIKMTGKRLVPTPFGADLVLTNPPFGSKIGITDQRILANFALGHNWSFSASEGKWIQADTVRKVQDPQILFLDLCLQLVREGGLLGIVLPEGLFGNRKTGYVWDFVRSMGYIETMIDCPRTTFQPGTDTKTNIAFIRKNRTRSPTTKPKAMIAIAKHCGHDRRGRIKTAKGNNIQNDFETLSSAYDGTSSLWWSECKLQDPYYIVPRYCYESGHRGAKSLAQAWNGETVRFGDLLTSGGLIVRKGHEVGADAYGTGTIPFIRTSDVANWEVSVSPTNGISEKIYQKYAHKQNVQVDDILLVVDGRYKIGRTAILHDRDRRAVVQSHFRIITATEQSPLDPYELLYIMSRPEILDEMRNLVFIQSTLGSIGKRIEELVLPVPKKTQEWTGKILGFRELLKRRAAMLNSLVKFEVEEPEL